MSLSMLRRSSPAAAERRAHHIADLHSGWAGYRTIEPRPDHEGWDVLAAAVLDVPVRPAPVLLRVDVLAVAPFLVDFRTETYSGSTPIGGYPSAPAGLFVSRADLGGASDPRPTGPRRPLAELLWQLSGVAAASVFPRSTRERAYRIVRWPALEQASMPAVDIDAATRLVLRPHTVTELARATRLPVARVTRLIRALELMGALDRGSVMI